MIVTVTLNPALDLTYTVDALVPYGTHRVAAVLERPGGKGLNVAGVLHLLGEPVLATGLLGGATGARITALLAAQGVRAEFEPIAGETRRTVAVADGRDATGFWEPGPAVLAAEWAAFVGRFRALVGAGDVVALSGSLPPGVPIDGYATLIALAAAAGATTVLDTSGEALRHGLAAGPDLAKPNAAELAALPDPAVAHQARTVVVSRGPQGLLAHTPAGPFEAVPPEQLRGNPTGAGDACVAALARGLRDGTPWPVLLADAVALSAAAVAAPVAGAVDLPTYRRLLPAVHVN
ncbi:1-phosphofructokinase family hexose kinase [Actinoplanes sp. N902-109]|uniref:1-phosphofructokinase family hexose kinase n=1 Tax=Actinoplanes sp. (strain N902-109) TaxID=649831 RepID=UPI00032961D2|nr:hexose kinase [Actinoplanes sp. N902-109]AGL18041.1 putative sugar kinase [Actinoplanes sp. N902-109]